MATEKIYSVDVLICATAYVKASSKRDAKKKAQALVRNEVFQLELSEHVSDLQLSDPALPDASLSPSCTGIGLATGDSVDVAWQEG